MAKIIPAALPAILLFLRQAKLRQDAKCELLDQVVDFFRRVVESGHRGHYGGAGVVDAQHIFQMDAVQRRFAQTQHQRAALFQANVRSAREQIARGSGGDRAERAGRARNDHHAVHDGAAGGDAGADILIRQIFDFLCGSAGQQRRQFFRVRRDHAEFGGEQAHAGFACDEKNALRRARSAIEQAQNGLRVGRAARTCDADCNNDAAGFRHGWSLNQRV